MGHSKEDVVTTAIALLDQYGLPGLTMRRLAATLEVQQSALYWHFASKQMLLAAMAEEILDRGPAPAPAADWPGEVGNVAASVRDALLAYRDGAELVSTVYAFGLGAEGPHRRLVAVLEAAGAPRPDAAVAATVVLQFVLGFTFSEQQHLQASSAGAIEGVAPPDASAGPSSADPFREGVALILDGIRARMPRPAARAAPGS